MLLKNKNIILGIDPGYDRLGFAIIENDTKPKLLYSGCIKTKKEKTIPERIFEVGKEIEKLFKEWKPKIISIEKLFMFKNQKTVIAVAEICGIIKFLAKENNAKIIEMTPIQIKSSITSYGRADKNSVNKLISKIIKLPNRKILDDEIDAIAIAISGTFYNFHK